VQSHKHATQQGYATQSEAEPDTPNPHTGRETGLNNRVLFRWTAVFCGYLCCCGLRGTLEGHPLHVKGGTYTLFYVSDDGLVADSIFAIQALGEPKDFLGIEIY
jgi:hypothetical protein